MARPFAGHRALARRAASLTAASTAPDSGRSGTLPRAAGRACYPRQTAKSQKTKRQRTDRGAIPRRGARPSPGPLRDRFTRTPRMARSGTHPPAGGPMQDAHDQAAVVAPRATTVGSRLKSRACISSCGRLRKIDLDAQQYPPDDGPVGCGLRPAPTSLLCLIGDRRILTARHPRAANRIPPAHRCRRSAVMARWSPSPTPTEETKCPSTAP